MTPVCRISATGRVPCPTPGPTSNACVGTWGGVGCRHGCRQVKRCDVDMPAATGLPVLVGTVLAVWNHQNSRCEKRREKFPAVLCCKDKLGEALASQWHPAQAWDVAPGPHKPGTRRLARVD